MSIAKQFLPLSLITSIFLFTACGGGGSSSPLKSDENKDKITVPEKISIDIPDALKSNRNATSANKLFKAGSPSVESYGYQQLTQTISRAEDTVKEVKENMGYLTLMMPDIVDACKNTPKGEACNIEEGVVKLTVEEQTLSMGKIKYTQHVNSEKYQHIVVLDLKPTLQSMGESVEKDLETVKWSTDENHIETISDYKGSTDTFNMHLVYDKESNGASSMTITDKYSFDDMQGNFTLKLNEKNDVNHTVSVETSGTSKFQEESNSFSSKGVVDDNGGYLISKGSFEEETFAEKETFDNNGSLIKSTFCYRGDTCDMSNPNSWNTFDDTLGFDSDNFDNSDFNSSDFEIAPEMEYFALDILGGNVPKNSSCMLLHPDYDTSNLSVNVFENTVADIFLFTDGDHFGFINDSNFNDQLNDLPMVCIDEEESTLYLRSQEARPLLTIRD